MKYLFWVGITLVILAPLCQGTFSPSWYNTTIKTNAQNFGQVFTSASVGTFRTNTLGRMEIDAAIKLSFTATAGAQMNLLVEEVGLGTNTWTVSFPAITGITGSLTNHIHATINKNARYKFTDASGSGASAAINSYKESYR